MDWNNCIADKTRLLTKHYNSGRSGASIQYIVVHHNAGVNLTVDDCWNIWQNRKASAHYQVQSDGLIGQLVNDWDTAWHAGDWNANCRSIGIEHANNCAGPWTISDQALEAGAHLVAALCKLYGLGRPSWLGNVFPHSYFQATQCPGEIAGSQNAAYMSRAQAWYDAMVSGTEPEKAVSVQLYDGNATDAQRWAVSWDGDYVTLTSKSCGLALDVAGAGTASGTAVRVYTPNGTDAQKWKVVQKGGSYNPTNTAPVELVPKVNEDLRLDCVGAGKTNGTGIQIYTANGTAAQEWSILDHGDGTWTLINVGSSQALDVVGGGN